MNVDVVEGSQYLSLADRQIEATILDRDFDEAFFTALFFRGALVVPDIFFFISAHIERLVLDVPASLFALAVAEKSIIPWYRQGAESFGHIHEIIMNEGILGCRPRAEETAAALDAVCEHRDFEPGIWPTDLGLSYEKLLTETLRVPAEEISDAAHTSIATDVWNATDRWRFDALEQARALTARSGTGIRRGAIYTVIANQLGIVHPGEQVEDSDWLVKRCRDKDAVEAEALSHFLTWVNTLYQLNQAAAFGARRWVPPLHPIDTLVTSTHLIDALETQVRSSETPSLEVGIDLPVLDRFLAWQDPTALLDAREEGNLAYRPALARYILHPTPDNADRLTAATKAYAKLLQDRVPGPRARFRLIARPVAPAIKDWLTPLVMGTTGIAGALADVPLASGLTLSSAGYVILRRARRRRARSHHLVRFFPSLVFPPAGGASPD